MIGQIGAADSFQLDVPITDNGAPLSLTGATFTARAESADGALVTPTVTVPVAGTARLSLAAGALADGLWRLTLTVALPGGATQTVLDDQLLVAAAPRSAWLTVDEVKRHLNLEMDDHDGWIERAIAAAAGTLETSWDVIVEAGTRTITFPRFQSQMPLRRWPLRAVTAVRYTDTSDADQTVPSTDWRLGRPAGAAMLMLRQGKSWPIAATYADAVQVDVDAGPATPAVLPQQVRQAAMMLIDHWFTNRGAVVFGSMSKEVEYGVAYLLNPFRQAWIG